jgi:hypothetical protein
MSIKKEENYYMKKKRTLMRTFDAATAIIKDLLIKKFGEKKFTELVEKAREDFESLLPQIPYVGGKESHLTDSLINGVILLPLLRIFEEEGMTFEEIGEFSYEIFEVFFKMIPPTDDIFSEEYLNLMKERAQLSKSKKYPGDWVYDFVEGDSKRFTWGVDYYECGLHKFYKSQDMDHLMPILCISDFAQARAYGYGLTRTQTIGNGAPVCDFRYIKDGSTDRAWPPDDLPEFKKPKKI